jgi:hypothetical protein
MSKDHAIVIGLSQYKLSKYNLTAPVRDALRFASWVTQPGRVPRDKDHLHLLLSPHDDDDLGEFDQLWEEATVWNMRNILEYYSRKDIEKPKRLWIYYAGHAIAPFGSGMERGPQLMPPDVENIKALQQMPLLDFDAVRKPLLKNGPEEQVIFIDACRAQLDSDMGFHGSTQLVFDNRLESLSLPKIQAVLYATTQGFLAHEVGTGLFSEALLKGLHGRAQLNDISFENRFYLRFPELVNYVTAEVRRLAENARLTQVPDPLRRPDLVLAEFDTRPKATITLHVRPQEALADAEVSIKTQAEGLKSIGPPAQPPLRWDVSLGTVDYQIIADGFHRVVKRGLKIYDNKVEPVRLSPLSWSATLETPIDRPAPLEVMPDVTTTLSLVAKDRFVSHMVIDDQGTHVQSGLGSAEYDLQTGRYKIQWSLPGSGVVSTAEIELMPEGHKEEYAPQPGSNPFPAALTGSLNAAGMNVTGAALFPSEVLGFATFKHLGSLLSWAADAARYPDGAGDKFQRLGVEAVNTTEGSSWLQVLVGDAGSNQHSMLDNLEVRFGRSGAETALETTELPGLAGFARQTQTVVPEEGASLVITSPGVNEVALPVPPVTGCISVVILTRDPSGQLEIHRYLHEAKPQQPFSDMIRVREQQWRALERRTPISNEEAESLLNDEFIDPLTRIVIGYRLLLAERLALWIDLVDVNELQQVPDVAILTGLHEGADEAAVNRALNSLDTRLPLLGLGFQTLHQWLHQKARRKGLPPPLPLRSPIPGAVWTTFDAREAEAPVATSDAIPASVLSQYPALWIDRIAHVVEATGRIEWSVAKRLDIKGTGFYVAPSVLLTMNFLFDSVEGDSRSDDLAAWFVQVTDEERNALQQILRRSEGGYQSGDKLLTACFVKTADNKVLPTLPKLSFEAPVEGQRVVVVGFPKASGSLNESMKRAFTYDPKGQKYILPGEITKVSSDMIKYEAFTLGGMAGGPVVNLDTGEVIAIHFGGHFDEVTGIKYGMGLPLSRINEEAFWKLIRNQ